MRGGHAAVNIQSLLCAAETHGLGCQASLCLGSPESCLEILRHVSKSGAQHQSWVSLRRDLECDLVLPWFFT
jgi:hypothetical protein